MAYYGLIGLCNIMLRSKINFFEADLQFFVVSLFSILEREIWQMICDK
jgi:hypothetical protein